MGVRWRVEKVVCHEACQHELEAGEKRVNLVWGKCSVVRYGWEGGGLCYLKPSSKKEESGYEALSFYKITKITFLDISENQRG